MPGAIPAHISPSPKIGEGFGVRLKRAGTRAVRPILAPTFMGEGLRWEVMLL